MLPAKLKNFNTFGDGQSFIGLVKSLTLPKIAMAGEDYRGGGMLGPVKMDMGLEALEMESTYGGLMVPVMRQMGVFRHDGSLLRFNGAYQADDTGVTAAELVTRGRHTEFDMGDAEAGKDTEHKVKSALSYLKWTIAGRVEVEIDLVNCVYMVGGIDRMAEIRAAISGEGSPLDGLIPTPQLQVPGIGGLGLGDFI
jgi:P2 family phage contractile tail tube protein